MSADHVAVLVAAVAAALTACASVAVTLILRRRTLELRRLVTELRAELVPLARQAHVAVDQAATELVRVGDVLGSTEAVTARVDSASRLAYRAFSNPVVKAVAFGSGVGGATRRLLGRRRTP